MSLCVFGVCVCGGGTKNRRGKRPREILDPDNVVYNMMMYFDSGLFIFDDFHYFCCCSMSN